MERVGLGGRYVGAHPMAGTERSGFDASGADLLPGAPWAVTVAPGTHADHLLRVLALVTGPLAGRARVVTDTAHDEAVALVSHVPHVLATELLNLVAAGAGRPLALGLAAGSFRDGTRVARTDPRRTEAMVAGNAAAVARALRAAARDLDAVADALEAPGADAALDAFFDAADPVRELVAGPGAPSAVTVTIDLTGPGWRERLADLGAAGAVVERVDAAGRSVTLAVSRPAPS
jgi:prephenate dehydrogenase